MNTIRSAVARATWFAVPMSLAWACSSEAGEGAGGAPAVQAATKPVQASEKPADGTLFRLEARLLRPDGPWGEATYKIKRKDGKRVRAFDLDVGNAQPGVSYELKLDDFALGPSITSRKGELELEISEEDGELFPPGFPEPKVGSIFRVGELMELRFDELVKVSELQVSIAGPGTLAGRAKFEIDRLGNELTREFDLKLEEAPVDTVHAVTLDGVHVADLKIDVEGRGKMKFSSTRPEPFPPGFPEPHSGSVIQVGDLFRGELLETLASAAQ